MGKISDDDVENEIGDSPEKQIGPLLAGIVAKKFPVVNGFIPTVEDRTTKGANV